MTTHIKAEQLELLADLREVIDAVRKDYRVREKAANAPMPVLRAAAILAEQPGLESSSLAEALRLERSTVSNLLRDMEARGLIRRRKIRSDRRFVSLELTERGHALLRKAGKAGSGLLPGAIDQLATDETLRLSLAIKPLVLAVRKSVLARESSQGTRIRAAS